GKPSGNHRHHQNSPAKLRPDEHHPNNKRRVAHIVRQNAKANRRQSQMKAMNS
ncbi:hypothetical protein HMPREF0168_1951, partial [Bifidobacterium dentium ATCC 27679]